MGDIQTRRSVSTVSAQNHRNIKTYSSKPDQVKGIPPYLDNFQMVANSLELRAFYDAPTKQTTFTYSISWEDYTKPQDNSSISSMSNSTDNSRKSSVKTNTELIFTGSPKALFPVMALCDGPCKKLISSNKLNTIGRCGHYLCDACYGIVINSDGSKGCSSLQCNWAGPTREALSSYNKKIVHKQRERAKVLQGRGLDVKPASSISGLSTFSDSNDSKYSSDDNGYELISDSTDPVTDTSSPVTSVLIENNTDNEAKNIGCATIYPGRNEMTVVKLILIEKSQFNATLRIHHQVESITSEKLHRVLSAMLLDNKRNPYGIFECATVYYVKNERDGTKKLKRVSEDVLRTGRLYDFPQINDYLYFIIDTIGYVKKKPVKLFLNFDS